MPKELSSINLTLLGRALIKIYQIKKTDFAFANLPSHMPLLVYQFLVKEDLKYPPYLPDWALCDFDIFKTKNLLQRVLF
jgi:hypothetical protein